MRQKRYGKFCRKQAANNFGKPRQKSLRFAFAGECCFGAILNACAPGYGSLADRFCLAEQKSIRSLEPTLGSSEQLVGVAEQWR